MFSSLRKLVSPKMIQEINGAIYNYVKLSLFMSVYSLPWVVVNLLFKFSVTTFIFYAIAFLFVLPNLMTLQQFLHDEVTTFKEYTAGLKNSYGKKFKVGTILTAFLSFCLVDSYILMVQMGKMFVFPVIYITLMFIGISIIYYLALEEMTATTWQIKLKKALFTSWRYTFTTVFLLILVMLWASIGYYVQLLNILFGNALFWGIIFNVTNKKLSSLWKNEKERKGDSYE
ncbi:hypothetical protein IGI37_003510 [Enterococcus sp. AZ194]|uniref:hypothetical protein n=1 Tax=Enterococcus sp. AZ194 TaxID=2774629 RepID=UPI003F2393C9